MVFKRLFSKLFGRWPTDLPRLYPDADDLQLAQFLTEPEYERIKSFDNAYILPFVSEESEPDQACFGLGLARLMIRNLMLLRDVSIHGPEDTPLIPFESAKELADQGRRSCYVSGVADFGEAGYTLRVEVYRPGRASTSTTVHHGDFGAFVRECSAAIGRSLGSGLETTVADAWDVGQPNDARSLERCGELSLGFDDEDKAAKSGAALQALAADPGFVLPAWDIDEELAESRKLYVEALRRDPYNAQLCFSTFCTIWTSHGPQPEAMQFCRKAIELSPGHGKAHMCAPHAAHPRADMLKHSELGYRLLPGNPFAVNNYTLYLRQIGAPPAKLVELAEEGIASDACDPGNYMQAIQLLCEMGAYRKALAVAEQLQELYEPEMNERALYCLKQNPERARMIEAGEYDPAAENRRLIAELRRQAAQSRTF